MLSLQQSEPLLIKLSNYKIDGSKFQCLLALQPIFGWQNEYKYQIGIQIEFRADRNMQDKLRLLDTVLYHIPRSLSGEDMFDIIRIFPTNVMGDSTAHPYVRVSPLLNKTFITDSKNGEKVDILHDNKNNDKMNESNTKDNRTDNNDVRSELDNDDYHNSGNNNILKGVGRDNEDKKYDLHKLDGILRELDCDFSTEKEDVSRKTQEPYRKAESDELKHKVDLNAHTDTGHTTVSSTTTTSITTTTASVSRNELDNNNYNNNNNNSSSSRGRIQHNTSDEYMSKITGTTEFESYGNGRRSEKSSGLPSGIPTPPTAEYDYHSLNAALTKIIWLKNPGTTLRNILQHTEWKKFFVKYAEDFGTLLGMTCLDFWLQSMEIENTEPGLKQIKLLRNFCLNNKRNGMFYFSADMNYGEFRSTDWSAIMRDISARSVETEAILACDCFQGFMDHTLSVELIDAIHSS